MLNSSIWRQCCCAVTPVTPKCFHLNLNYCIEVSQMHSNWTKPLKSRSNGWTRKRRACWRHCVVFRNTEISVYSKLTLSRREHTPKLAQPNRMLHLHTHTHTQRKTKWLKSIESTLSKATLMKLNVAPIYCFPKHMKWEIGSCMDASLERVKQELWGRVLRWRRVVCVGVQLCIHERNSCGRFSQLDKAKVAAGAVCSRQHEWKPEINKL